MGLPVVTVAAGGLPVVDTGASLRGTPVTEAPNGIGMRVTKVAAYGLPVAYETIGVAAAMAVLDQASAAETTLSNGGLTATRTAQVQVYGGAHSTSFKSSGKYYFEFLNNTDLKPETWGIMNTLATYTNMGNDSTNCFYVYYGGGIWSNGTDLTIPLGAIRIGERACFAIDLTARLGWIRRQGGNWNNSGTANPATGVGGAVIGPGSFAPATAFGSGTVGTNTTANFGATAFTFTVPSGFTAGWPA